MHKYKVLFLCQHFYPEMVSTGLHMTELTTKMVELDSAIEINVFCAEPSKEEYFQYQFKKKDTYKNVKINRVSNWGKQHSSILYRLLFSVGFFLKAVIYTIYTNKSYDLIVCTTNPPFLSVVPYFIKKIFNKSFVLIVYDIYPDIAVKLEVIKRNGIIANLLSWLNRKIYNSADRIIVIGEDMSALVKRRMMIKDHSKMELIHNWSDKDSVKPIEFEKNEFIKKYKLQGKKILMYSGNMGRTHNIEPILEAALALKYHKDIVFVFIGSGAKKNDVTHFIKENNLINILQLPYQPIEFISHSISAAQLAFVCLEKEFTGLSVPSKAYGIMAAKVPLIGLLDDSSEIAITINKFNCGKVWNQHSEIRLDTLLLNLLNDNRGTLKAMADNAYAAFLKNYDIGISANKYNSMIKKVLINGKN